MQQAPYADSQCLTAVVVLFFKPFPVFLCSHFIEELLSSADETAAPMAPSTLQQASLTLPVMCSPAAEKPFHIGGFQVGQDQIHIRFDIRDKNGYLK